MRKVTLWVTFFVILSSVSQTWAVPSRSTTDDRPQTTYTVENVLKHMTEDYVSKVESARNGGPVVEDIRIVYAVESSLIKEKERGGFQIRGGKGVGKSTALYSIALMLRKHGKSLVLLKPDALLADSSLEGQFESKSETLLEAIRSNKDQIVLAIEGADITSSEKVKNFISRLATLSASGEISTIFVLDDELYARKISKELPALEKLTLLEMPKPTKAQVKEQLENRIDFLEKKYNLQIDLDLVERIVDLTHQYQSSLPLADQSYKNLVGYLARIAAAATGDTLEDRVTEAKIKTLLRRRGLLQSNIERAGSGDTTELQYRLIEVDAELEQLNRHTNPQVQEIRMALTQATERADSLERMNSKDPSIVKEIAELKGYIPELRKSLAAAQADAQLTGGETRPSIKGFEAFLGEATNQNPKLFTSNRAEFLDFVEAEAKKSVIGQDRAIEAIMKVIGRQTSRLNRNPRGEAIPSNVLILGPTGVGKTELVKVLSRLLYGEDSLIKINGGDYSEGHSGSKLVGAPPGYVGYDEGGILSEAVRKRPFFLAFFDEVGRMNQQVHDLIYPILDDGKAADAQNRVIDYSNGLIAGALNAGDEYPIMKMHYLKEMKDPAGFAKYVESTWGISVEEQSKMQMEDIDRTIAIQALRQKGFQDAFLGRWVPIWAEALTFDEIATIARNMLKTRIDVFYQVTKAHLVLNESVVYAVARAGYDDQLGARPLREAEQANITDFLAKFVNREEVKRGDQLKLTTIEMPVKEDGVILKGEVIRDGQVVVTRESPIRFRKYGVTKPTLSAEEKAKQDILNRAKKGKSAAAAKAQLKVRAEEAKEPAVRRATKTSVRKVRP